MAKGFRAKVVSYYRSQGLDVSFPAEPRSGMGRWQVWRVFFDGSSEKLNVGLAKADAERWVDHLNKNRSYSDRKESISYKAVHPGDDDVREEPSQPDEAPRDEIFEEVEFCAQCEEEAYTF